MDLNAFQLSSPLRPKKPFAWAIVPGPIGVPFMSMGTGPSLVHVALISILLAGCMRTERSSSASGVDGVVTLPTIERSESSWLPDNSPTTRLDRFFHLTKDLEFDYSDTEAVMRGLAYAACHQTFLPEHYAILESIQYDVGDGQTGGELDVIVWNRRRDMAERVYGVKLTGNPEDAYRQCMQQLGRFRRCVQHETINQFRRGHEILPITQAQFSRVAEYGSIGSRGTTAAGFSLEIDITQDEASILLERLRTYRE